MPLTFKTYRERGFLIHTFFYVFIMADSWSRTFPPCILYDLIQVPIRFHFQFIMMSSCFGPMDYSYSTDWYVNGYFLIIWKLQIFFRVVRLGTYRFFFAFFIWFESILRFSKIDKMWYFRLYQIMIYLIFMLRSWIFSPLMTLCLKVRKFMISTIELII